MRDITQSCIEAYQSTMNLKLAAGRVGIPWQTVYTHLRRAGIPVTGDKSRYGSATDRLAAKAEQLFQELVPSAINNNRNKFQAKIDFMVGKFGVDIKSSNKNLGHIKAKTRRWAFCMKKQEMCADFFVCFAYENGSLKHVFLLPGELVSKYATISITDRKDGKWWDYEISPNELRAFFESMAEI